MPKGLESVEGPPKAEGGAVETKESREFAGYDHELNQWLMVLYYFKENYLNDVKIDDWITETEKVKNDRDSILAASLIERLKEEFQEKKG